MKDYIKYEGLYNEGKLYGKSKISYPDGKVYEGDIKEVFSGTFVVETEEEGVVRGYTWEKGYPHGKGIMIYLSGSHFKGEFIDGIPKSGIMTYADGRIYEGSWGEPDSDGLYGPDGYGVMTYGDGRVYEGLWNCGNPDGAGKITLNGLGVSEGEWINDKWIEERFIEPEHEIIQFTGQDGLKYICSELVIDSVIYGKGEIIFPDGTKIKKCNGGFKNYVPHGRGECTYISGEVYIGEFVDGSPHGKGRLTLTDGTYREGDWVKGVMEGR